MEYRHFPDAVSEMQRGLRHLIHLWSNGMQAETCAGHLLS